MVEATKSYKERMREARAEARAKPKDFRPTLWAMSRYFAKQEAIAQIRARGHKITHYAAKDITRMADALLRGNGMSLQDPDSSSRLFVSRPGTLTLTGKVDFEDRRRLRDQLIAHDNGC